MNAILRNFLTSAMLLGLLAGCGGSSGTQTGQSGGVPATQGVPAAIASPVPSISALDQARLDDPQLALSLLPTANIDPPIVGKSAEASASTSIPVATLETNYETLFCPISAKYSLTINSPRAQAKIAFIKSQAATGHFDLTASPIAKNAVGVTSVLFQPVAYDTTVTLPSGSQQTYHVSGGLLMPQGIDKTKIRGIIVYFHGTTFDKSTVGSNYATNIETQLNAELFASQGYIVALPDYIGQGIDWKDVHPYVLYPQISAKTAVDMLTSIKQTLVSQYQYTSTDTLKLFSAGYSEGGSYSLWFNTFISSNAGVLDSFYKLTHSVGMEGAYSTSQVTRGYLFDNVSKLINTYNVQTQLLVNMVKPPLSADAFLSYATYSGASDFASVFNMNFFNLDCGLLIGQSKCDVGGQHLDIASAFAMPSTNIITALVSASFGKTANLAIYPSRVDMAFSPFNSVNALVSSSLLTSAAQQKLALVLAAADANLSSVANNGVSIITLAQDSVVVPNNFDALLATYPSKIKNHIKINPDDLPVLSPFTDKISPIPIFEPVDHLQGPVFEFIYALNIFNSFQ